MPARPQRWTRLRLPVPHEATDAVAALCIELGAPGVVTGQSDFRRKKRSSRVSRSTRIEAYFPPDVPRRRLERRLRAALHGVREHFVKLDPGRAEIEPFETGDYGTAWRAHFPPIAVGKHLVIAPSWCDVEQDGRHILRVDPGQAFGTGHHPTTRGCLLEIEQVCAKAAPPRGLDVGCGSGVLALAMRAFGAKRVSAVDNDPLALVATHDAARANRLGPIATGPSLASRRGLYELIAANLFANLLVELAPKLAARLAPGGTLIVSGLLDSQEKEVRAALRATGLRLHRRRCLSTWVTLVARSPARGRCDVPRLFVEVDADQPDRARLPSDGMRHLRALRLGVGDAFEAIVGPGVVRVATLESVTRHRAAVRLGEAVPVGPADPAQPLVLAIALADFARFDAVIEKATELGATKVVPLRAARSQIGKLTEARRERWRRIARSACEQCGRTVPPEIGVEVSLDEVDAHLPQGACRVVFSPEAVEAWDGDAERTKALVLYIGPEGGFTSEEVRRLCEGGARLRSLGDRTLRFETAASAALAIAGARRG